MSEKPREKITAIAALNKMYWNTLAPGNSYCCSKNSNK
jgi:hypothetical protein